MPASEPWLWLRCKVSIHTYLVKAALVFPKIKSSAGASGGATVCAGSRRGAPVSRGGMCIAMLTDCPEPGGQSSQSVRTTAHARPGRGKAWPESVECVQIRSLCRKQFFARALGNKVAARQHNQRAPASSQHGRQPAAVQMPQGDSWASPGVLGGGYMGGFSNPLSQHR